MGFQGQVVVACTNGVIRPDERLDLPDGTRPRAVIRPARPDPGAAERAVQRLRQISESGALRSGGRERGTDSTVHRE